MKSCARQARSSSAGLSYRVHFVKSVEYPNGTKKEIRNSTEFTLHPTCEDGSEVKVYYHRPIKTMDDFNNKDFFTVPKEGEEPGSDWIRAEKNGKYSKVRLKQRNNVIMTCKIRFRTICLLCPIPNRSTV